MSWQSICELQKARSLFKDVQHIESRIAGGLDPVSVNFSWESSCRVLVDNLSILSVWTTFALHARIAIPLAHPHSSKWYFPRFRHAEGSLQLSHMNSRTLHVLGTHAPGFLERRKESVATPSHA